MNKTTDNLKRKWLARLAVFCSAGVLLVLLYFLVVTRGPRIKSSAKLVKLRSRQEELEEYSKWMAQYVAVHNNYKSTIFATVDQARSIKDIPDLGLGEIIWSTYNNRNMCVVPKGKHTLTVTGCWRTLTDADQKIIPHPDGSIYKPLAAWRAEGVDGFDDSSHSKQWKIPLEPESAYKFSFQNKNGKMTWKLTSNNSDFQTRSKVFPVKVVKRGVSQFFTSKWLLLPGEIVNRTVITEPLSNKQHLFHGYYDFEGENKKQTGFIIRVEISSESEPCFSRRTALRMMARKMEELVTVEEKSKSYLLNREAATKAVLGKSLRFRNTEIQIPPDYIDTFY